MEQEPIAEPKPRIWLGDSKARDAGELHGHWIDATNEAAFVDELAEIFGTSPVKNPDDYYIAAFEGFFNIGIEMDTSLETVCRIAKLIDEYGEPIAHWIEINDFDLESTEDTFLQAYMGEWTTLKDLLESLKDDKDIITSLAAHIPESLQRHYKLEDFDFTLGEPSKGKYVITMNRSGHVFVFNNV